MLERAATSDSSLLRTAYAIIAFPTMANTMKIRKNK